MKTSGLKISSYNHFFRMEDGTALLFNANTSALAQIQKESVEEIENLLNNPQNILSNNEQLDPLIERGFILNENEDEKAIIRDRLMNARYSKEYCSLTLAPTMGCNFNCSYCFESEEVRAQYDHMSAATQAQLICFLHEHFTRYKTKKLEVCWFGGEPLLALSAIQEISKNLIKECQDLNIHYSASIITNGYRLNSETASILRECQISQAQITIDGPQIIHDSRRILKGGKGSYRRILKNVKESSNIINIVLRVNIDNQNYRYLQEMLKEMECDSVKKNVKIELAYVHINSDESKYDLPVSRKFFSDIDLEFKYTVRKYGFNRFENPRGVTNACGGDQAYSYMIGPKGEIYQCWEDFGKQELSVGSIFTDKKKNQDYVKEYMDFDPTQHPKCSGCSVLPLCMGGCPKHRLLHNGEPQCGVFKFNLKGYLLGLINQRKNDLVLQEKKISFPEELQELFFYKKWFHKPIPNNYVYLLIPNDFSVDDYVKTVESFTMPLNIADEKLLAFFERALEKEKIPSVQLWREVIESKNNLLSIFYAEKTIQFFEKNVASNSINKFLENHSPELLHNFIGIPRQLMRINRINFYVENQKVSEYLQKLLHLFTEKAKFFSLIDRFEVAKRDIKNPEETSYPTIIIYLKDILFESPYLTELLLNLKAMFSSLNNTIGPVEFGYQWLPNVTITQGFKLYKRYLVALKSIDFIYDRGYNFAFMKEDSTQWLSVLP